MSTVHNPSNFRPQDYEILDYLDNRPPDYFGQPVEVYRQEREYWAKEMETVLGKDWRKKMHHCCHCGNGNVRYIVACLHGPTGERVVFGDICVDRLQFENREEWKAKELRAKVQVQHARLRDYQRYCDYLDNRPDVREIVKESEKEIHKDNLFVHDVLGKLKKYGSLSDKQVNAVRKSLDRDYTWARDKERWEAKKAKQRETAVHIGKIGVRSEMTLKLVKVVEIEKPDAYSHRWDAYSTTYLHIFEEPETCSPVKWFASRKQDFEEGRTYRVKATVKKHDVYDGIKQTLVNRVAGLEEVE